MRVTRGVHCGSIYEKTRESIAFDARCIWIGTAAQQQVRQSNKRPPLRKQIQFNKSVVSIKLFYIAKMEGIYYLFIEPNKYIESSQFSWRLLKMIITVHSAGNCSDRSKL